MLGLVVGIACAIFFVGLLFYAQKYKRRLVADTAGLKAWAADHGYRFADVDDSWADRWTFSPFGIGDFQSAFNVASGEYLEMEFAAFDYTFKSTGVVSSGGAAAPKIWHYAVITVQLPDQPPWFDVRQRTGMLKAKTDANEFAIGNAEFDDRWRVHSDDESYTKAALSDTTRATIIELELTGVRVVAGQLVAWRLNSHHNADNITAQLDAVARLAAGLPSAA